MIAFSRVDLFKNLTVSGKTYYEDSLHRPRFPAPVDEYSTPPSIGISDFTFDNVTPRKGKEFSEMELPLDVSTLSDLTNPGLTPVKLICI